MPTAAPESGFPAFLPSASGWRRAARVRAARTGLVRVRIWDLPTRLFHWSLAASIVALTGTGLAGGAWMEWHARIGTFVLALLLFRLAWGFVGGRWSRFAGFLPTPRRLRAYLRGEGGPEADAGHSPLGALSVFAMLGVVLALVVTGLVADDGGGFTGPWNALVSAGTAASATLLHRKLGAWLLVALVVLHIAAIAWYRVRRNRKLVGAMVGGDKMMRFPVAHARDDAGTRLLALVLFAASVLAVSWLAGF